MLNRTSFKTKWGIRAACCCIIMVVLYSCNKKKPVIEPISKEHNKAFLTGNGLDSNLFSSKDIFQYYQIADYGELSASELMSSLNAFVNGHYKLTDIVLFQRLDILFYQKKVFSNYGNLVYESARDNESGGLSGHRADLVARVTFAGTPNKPTQVIRNTILYHPDAGEPVVTTDTLNTKLTEHN